MRIIFMVLALVLCLSCATVEEKETSRQLRKERIRELEIKRITKIQYEGHDYLIYQYGNSGAGICHSHSCNCMK